MSPSQRSDITAAFPIAVDAFLRLSRIHLESLERLSALKLSTSRQAVDDFATTAKQRSMEIAEPKPLQSLLGRPIWGQ
jgi:hypothetical protein